MQIRNGFIQMQYFESESCICDDEKCRRSISTNDWCFIDVTTKKLYCDSCGKCLRYARKKEEQRQLKN